MHATARTIDAKDNSNTKTETADKPAIHDTSLQTWKWNEVHEEMYAQISKTQIFITFHYWRTLLQDIPHQSHRVAIFTRHSLRLAYWFPSFIINDKLRQATINVTILFSLFN